jgi:electron transfer flavoprotein beta subunit
MRIIVLIKPGVELEDSDACAVEHALRVARRRLDVQVSVLTTGPPTCVRSLRAALALGADDAVHVPDSHTSPYDALTLSRILATTIRELGFNLVLCGDASDTPNLSLLPAMIAARLGIPAQCHASCIDFGALDTTPTLISFTSQSASPRYPPFPAIAEARQKLISTRALPKIDIEPADVITVKPLCPQSNSIIEAYEDPHAAAVQLVDFLAARRFI